MGSWVNYKAHYPDDGYMVGPSYEFADRSEEDEAFAVFGVYWRIYNKKYGNIYWGDWCDRFWPLVKEYA